MSLGEAMVAGATVAVSACVFYNVTGWVQAWIQRRKARTVEH